VGAESQGYGLGIEQVESLMGFGVSPCGTAWGHIGLGQVTTVAFTTPDAKRQVVLMANAMLTSDAALSALNGATWSVLCSYLLTLGTSPNTRLPRGAVAPSCGGGTWRWNHGS
jgi:hypothetical protein